MIGLYGGTFNPIHQGHLRAAEEVAEALELDRMLFIPSARPPHKREVGDDVIAPAKLRLEWVALAVQENPRFVVDPIELDRPGPSYLVDTLIQLRERHAGEDLVFTVGQDAFAEMGLWREPERLFALAHIAVTTRPPVGEGHLEEWLPECVRGDFEVAADGLSAQHRTAGTWIRQLSITALDISASEIRQRVREGRSIRYLAPEPVRAAIEASRCYKAEPRTPGSCDASRREGRGGSEEDAQ
jgi:nicotinate-nucleotide adenylyltransferase